MAHRKTAHVTQPEPVKELVFEDEIEEREEEESRPNRGLDLYTEDGELAEPAEPTYFEEEETEDD